MDEFAKAGVDLTADLTDLARGASVSASYTASGTTTAAAVDGYPINEPFWGAGGSPNAQDWYEVDFGSAKTLDEVRLYFKDSRPASGTYRHRRRTRSSICPAAPGPPPPPRRRRRAPRSNHNVVRFAPVTAQRVRVLMTHAPGARSGLTEMRIYNRGGSNPQPTTNLARSATPSASYTSPWESVAALNDGIDPPSSNDTVNPRWGTWPQQGTQWAELTWPSAVTLGRAQVYLFDDDQGIDLPASWRLQYWNGGAYVDVPGASGYPVAADRYNAVTFTPVSTTRLRVVLQSAADHSVGLLEVKAYGP